MITETSRDPVPAIVTFLRGKTDAGNHVYGGSFPKGINEGLPAIVLRVEGASYEAYRVRIVIRAETEPEAMEVWEQVEAYMSRCAPPITGLYSGFCTREAGPDTGMDYDSKWPEVTVVYRLEMGG